MVRPRTRNFASWATWMFAIAALSAVLGAAPSVLAASTSNGSLHGSAAVTLPSTPFVPAPPPGAKGPDDLTQLAVDGVDHGRLVIWTAYQNGVNPNGTPGTPGGPTVSTIAGYDAGNGALVRTINVTGKVDGMTADPGRGVLLASVNEDSNSAFDVVYPALGAVARYTYSPSTQVSGNGGTDSIAVKDGAIYVVHSNPNDTSQASDYLVQLHRSTLVAQLTPVFFDNSAAVDAITGAPLTLALTDPDTNLIMPPSSPRFAGALATISQGDGQIVFASHLKGSVHLSRLTLTDNVSGNIPPADGLAVATCGSGTLYVVDASANTISALDTTGWPAGTVFVGEPKDTGNPLVGSLDLSTGLISPFGNHFVSPKGLLFVAHGCGEGDDHGDQGQHGDPMPDGPDGEDASPTSDRGHWVGRGAD